MGKGYNKRNKLLRIQDIQTKFKEVYKQGMVIEWVFNNHIKSQFRISRKTFYDAMKVNVKQELEKVKDVQQNKSKYKQATMDFFSKQP